MASYDYQYIGQKLLSSTEVTDVVSQRVSFGLRPETQTTFPSITYYLVSRPNIAFGVAERPRYQISCRAENPATAMNLGHIVHGVFNNRSETIGGFDMNNTYFEDSTLIPEQNNIFNCVIDIFLQYVNYD